MDQAELVLDDVSISQKFYSPCFEFKDGLFLGIDPDIRSRTRGKHTSSL